jgi:hypothetical protein
MKKCIFIVIILFAFSNPIIGQHIPTGISKLQLADYAKRMGGIIRHHPQHIFGYNDSNIIDIDSITMFGIKGKLSFSANIHDSIFAYFFSMKNISRSTFKIIYKNVQKEFHLNKGKESLDGSVYNILWTNDSNADNLIIYMIYFIKERNVEITYLNNNYR